MRLVEQQHSPKQGDGADDHSQRYRLSEPVGRKQVLGCMLDERVKICRKQGVPGFPYLSTGDRAPILADIVAFPVDPTWTMGVPGTCNGVGWFLRPTTVTRPPPTIAPTAKTAACTKVELDIVVRNQGPVPCPTPGASLDQASFCLLPSAQYCIYVESRRAH